MSKAVSFANDVLDATYNNAASGTVVLGSTTYTLPMRLCFLSTVETDTTPGTEWATSGGYTAGGVSVAGSFATAAASKSKASSAAISVTNAPAQVWADNRFQDSSAPAKRTVFRGGTSLGKTVNAGDSCIVPSGSLTGTDG